MEEMMGFGSIRISQTEINNFHSVDRTLYATLVMDLCRDPIEAVQMMALWLWLERVGVAYFNLTRRILTLPFQLINEMGDEALLFWSCLNNTDLLYSSHASLEIPVTHMLLRTEISLEFLRMHHHTAINGINTVIKRVCVISLKDIMEQAIQRNTHLAFLQSVGPRAAGPRLIPDREMTGQDTSRLLGLPCQESQQAAAPVVHPDDRTMFVTFSKGYPVAEWEVKDFFVGLFGDCIESFYMQEVGAEEQSLYAKIVFYHHSFIDVVLDGAITAKFTINGKHVWMRKFIPKQRHTGAISSTQ